MKIICVVAVLVAAVTTSCVPSINQEQHPVFEPLPLCETCVSKVDIVAPGLGFDLAMDYGASAIRYHNGSVHDGVRVDAGKEYIQMMQRLADPEYEPACYPGKVPNGLNEKLACRLYWTGRWLNEKRGLPATPEIGIIADLLSRLREVTSSSLDVFIDRAVISRPDLPYLVTEDIEDAAEYAGFKAQRTRHVASRVTETSAAFAGTGRGLCKQYEDIWDCQEEEYELPDHVALRLTLTDAALTASCSWMQSAYFDFASIDAYRFDLGFGNFSGDPSRWPALVQDFVFGVGRGCERFPDTLLFLGEHAENAEFARAVKAALQDLLEGETAKNPRKHTKANEGTPDVAYLAARGAAEFAKRAREGPNACLETEYCKEKRRRLHDEEATLASAKYRPLHQATTRFQEVLTS